jgi:hypothetical protein
MSNVEAATFTKDIFVSGMFLEPAMLLLYATLLQGGEISDTIDPTGVLTFLSKQFRRLKVVEGVMSIVTRSTQKISRCGTQKDAEQNSILGMDIFRQCVCT